MIINCRSIARWLAILVLLADVAAAGLVAPAPDAPLWADLARVCSTESGEADHPPSHADSRLCVFCLPLMDGPTLAPDGLAAHAPVGDYATCSVAQAGPWWPAAIRAHLARGPPSA